MTGGEEEWEQEDDAMKVHGSCVALTRRSLWQVLDGGKGHECWFCWDC